jgi:hypothetical protein
VGVVAGEGGGARDVEGGLAAQLEGDAALDLAEVAGVEGGEEQGRRLPLAEARDRQLLRGVAELVLQRDVEVGDEEAPAGLERREEALVWAPTVIARSRLLPVSV